MPDPRTTIVVPNYNGARHLAALLPGIASQSRQPARVLVVDNCSTDDSREAVGDQAECLMLDRNYGFAYAVNRGLEAVETEYVAIVNNDVIFENHWLASLEDALLDPTVWFACPRLRVAADPSRLDGTWDLLSRAGCPLRALHGEPVDHPKAVQFRGVHFPPMTASLFRTSLFHSVGLIDEAFVNYLEDVDFGLRCALSGHHGAYVPQALASHVGSATLGAWSSRAAYWNARNQVLLLARHFPSALIRRWWRPILAGQLLYLLMAMRRGHPIAALRGKAEILLGWKRFRYSLQESDLRQTQQRVSALHHLLEQSEREIAALVEDSPAPNRFWRIYLALAGQLGGQC